MLVWDFAGVVDRNAMLAENAARDTPAAAVKAVVSGGLAVSEVRDTAAATVVVRVGLMLGATEARDTLAATATVVVPREATLAGAAAPDAAAAAGWACGSRLRYLPASRATWYRRQSRCRTPCRWLRLRRMMYWRPRPAGR